MLNSIKEMEDSDGEIIEEENFYYGIENLECLKSLKNTNPALIKVYGSIQSIVKNLIVVAPNTDSPYVDLETVFFLEDGTCLGIVCDIFGNLETPHYLVAAALNEMSKGLSDGNEVYYEPNNTKLLLNLDDIVSDSDNQEEIASDDELKA